MSKMSELAARIDEVKEKMCDEYCKWPLAYSLDYVSKEQAHEAVLRERCAECPLNRL